MTESPPPKKKKAQVVSRQNMLIWIWNVVCYFDWRTWIAFWKRSASPKDKEIEHFKVIPKDKLGELHRSSGIVRIMDLCGFDWLAAKIKETMNAYRTLMVKLTRKRPLGSVTSSWIWRRQVSRMELVQWRISTTNLRGFVSIVLLGTA
jgi:hypothetical protein